ncbi:hypothetical protein [Rhodocyclus tenuis]|uniref:Sel1 repeat family protein n=1 Tax=Rhodocyclus tenuis TaxID=1066 RepID=A0A840G8K4_RHOTE|nr:hypothetical protein [Rhodocyclus tenuis]MBB4248205.1 hypothetical protein [Rhodocyclus tenuis]
MVRILLSKACVALSCLLMFSFPVGAIASSFAYKLLSEAASETLPIRTTTQLFVHELTKAVGNDFPSEALSDENYTRLNIELRRLSEHIDANGKNINSALDDSLWRSQIEMLQRRIQWLLNANLTRSCSKLGIDLESAKDSHGDWRKVRADGNPNMGRQPVGSEIKPSSHLHTKLYWYYRLGCNGKQDLETARRVLFDISDLEPKNFSERSELRPEIRHCAAEVWAKFGIGGAVDQERADEFSRRFTTAAYFLNRPYTPERRAELTERFPDAAKNNFKCPKPLDSMRIDPRDPWRDLW